MKQKKKIIIRNLLLFIFVCIFAYSLFNICVWLKNSKETKKQIKTINKDTTVEIIKDDDNVKMVDDNPDYYHMYKNVKLINVNFDELLKINNQTKGWVKVNDTNINYPFVQANNNSYYLTHTFDKKGNGGGWVFLDYRNNSNLDNINTILYGHGMQDKTIFGTLGNVLKSGYIEKEDNQFIMISTPTINLTYQIFSAYKIPNTSDYIQTEFSSDEEILAFYNMLKERSEINIDVPISSTDKILTLSTCYNNDIKIAVHAKLVKYLER